MKFLKFSQWTACYLFIFFALQTNTAAANGDQEKTSPIPVIETMALSTDPTMLYGKGFPGTVTRTISSNDKIAFYFAAIRVINPGKNKFELRLECVDSSGQLIIGNTTTREVHDLTESKYLDGKSGYMETSLGLNPAVDAIVPGQKMSLKNEEEYYVRLFIDDKLIGLTKFRYFIKSKPAKDQK